ncbi:hypothetical protein [Methanolobus psychrotolerans]|uniref:hypothetical protein n=1 Tax=Methanolobus psychrotolerans TaxID=1874706 RepID=UPI000B9199DB|nr:hypothetical protein [Methanolobus psychrotolerans]
MNYTIEEKLPSAEEYIILRESVSWSYPSKTAIEKSLNNSNYCVCAVKGGRVTGMSLVVGDDSFIFFIADVIVSRNIRIREFTLHFSLELF